MENLQEVIRLGSQLSVLYVEDDKALLEETGAIFRKIFKQVDYADNGMDGLNKFAHNSYDLVVTDIEMPEMNGLEMSQKIKEQNSEIPIIVISAYSNSSYLIDAINIGINYYVLKPIILPQLITTLKNVVEVIENRRIALVCQQQELQDTVKKRQEQFLHAMTDASPNPVVICDETGVVFFNEAFENLLESCELHLETNNSVEMMKMLEEKIVIDTLFKDEQEFVRELDLRELEAGDAVKLSLKTLQGTKIYLVLKNSLLIDEGVTMNMFTFNDITLLSFQNIQLKAYDRVMGKLTGEEYRSDKKSVEEDIINKTSFETE